MHKLGRSTFLALFVCLPFVVWAEEIPNFSDLDLSSLEDARSSLVRNVVVQPKYEFTSPWQVIPGSYSSGNSSYYSGNRDYKAKDIYANYLTSGAYGYYSKNCANFYGKMPKINKLDMDNAFDYASAGIKKRYPNYSNGPKSVLEKKEVEGKLLELASEYFGKYKCYSKYQLASVLPTLPIGEQYKSNRYGDASCTPFYNEKYECKEYSNSKYRTIDGSCNNRYHPYWGRSNTCHIRLLPSDYSDGVREFRMSHEGHPLPPPRAISNKVAESKDFKSYYTSMVLAIGQFINHDIANTESYVGDKNLDCCAKPDYRCASIHLTDPNDYVTKKYNSKCINFVRSTSCPLCKLGPSEQLNGQTAFIDLSLVYGPNIKETAKLRTFKNGLMATATDIHGKQILPPSDTAKPCDPLKKGTKCFAAGDGRCNQHPLLLSMHTIFLRNHNIHASRLHLINPHWNDEKIFQEARRLSIAEYQAIVYDEYLPVILGPILTEYYSLHSQYSGYTHYEPYTDPSSWNEFSTAASRYGHSQMKDYYKTVGHGNASSLILLRDNFFEPGFAWDDLLDDVIRGMVSDPSNTIDPYYSVTAKNFVLKTKSKSHGLDLVSVNILRGRDHGLPGYVHYLKSCFNYEAKSWKDLEKFIPVEVLAKMQQLYSSIYDIDLYIGGVSERHFIDASIGPTFSCLVGIQYYHLKFGDRYYYEHGGQSGSFKPAQLENIRRTSSLAHILCRGTSIKSLQAKVLYLPSKLNAPIDCSRYAEINYQLWKEAH